MSIKTRSNGIPLRGSGGGGGKIQVYNQSGGEDTELSLAVTKLKWATQDVLGFGATVAPDDPTCIIIGNPPVFLPEISWSAAKKTQVRVSESDISEPDTYLANGFEGQVVDGSLDNFVYNSTLGRGFGTDSRLSVKSYHAGTLVDDTTFTCAANGTQTDGNVTIQVSGYTEDGDGSAFAGQLRVTVNGNGVIGSTNSGMCRVEVSFLEHKFGERRNINQDVFRDKNPSSPIIDGGRYIQVPNDATTHVIKYLSGVGYFDLGSPTIFSMGGIKEHNEDTSKPTDSLVFDSSMFGVTDYTATPFLQPTSFNNYTNLDTQGSFTYSEKPPIDIANMRTIGTTKYTVTIADSWNTSAPYDSNDLRICIDTFNNPSTDTVEYFDLENKRLDSDYNSAWDSTRYCIDGEAIVFNGGLYHGADLPRVIENVEGALGTLGSLANSFPQEGITGSARQNPNYTGHTRDAVFFREFPTPDTTSKANFNVNILTNGDVESQLKSGDLQVYVWKLDSTNPVTVNINTPPAYSPTNQSASTVDSIWLHGNIDYNFGTFEDGAAQTNAGATCRTGVVGSVVNATFGGNDCLEGILIRVQLKRGVVVKELSVTFL
ncbi:hypothetical protein VPHK406_0022 [Vibrio phage K406]